MTFRFRAGLTIATLIALAILSALGTWQLQRRAWKLDLIAQTEHRLGAAPIAFADALARTSKGENMEYAPVYLDGVYDNLREARVFGLLDGAAGVYVFTPMTPRNGQDHVVYVNRGFAPQAFRDRQTRLDGEIDGPTRVEGLFRASERRHGVDAMVKPADAAGDNLYYTRDPAALAAAAGLATVDYYIDSDGRESAAPWPKGGVTRLEFSNRHLEYALTWYGLGAALIGVYLAFSLRRR
ncbi:MAG: SURF1 family protein [Parvularculaceae bacterium]|nr:SURF1 family protein [Parvularculaceae bacterium]